MSDTALLAMAALGRSSKRATVPVTIVKRDHDRQPALT